MADSKKPADQGLDQSDDLIAELARIVADDARRATVSQSIEQRAQQEPERSNSDSAFSPATKSAFADQQQQERQEREQRESEPKAESVTPQPQQEAPSQNAEDPFEFDFASSYRADAAQRESESKQFGVEIDRLVEQAESEPQPEPIAPQAQTSEQRQSAEVLRQEVNAAAEVDEIADLISKADNSGQAQQAETVSVSSENVEAEQVQPVEPQYDHESDALFADEPYMEQQEAPEEKRAPMAAPVSREPEPASQQQSANSSVSNDPLAEIERLIEDTSEGPAMSSHHSYLETPGDYGNENVNREDSSSAAEAAILAAMAAARPASDAAEPPNAQTPKAQAPIGPAPEAAPTAAAAASQRSTAPYLDREEPQPEPTLERETARRGQKDKKNLLPFYAGGLAALLLLGLGGATLWSFMGGGQSEGDVPLVTAQNTDVKQTPENTGEDSESPSVFSALEGQAEDSSAEQLVSRDDTEGASGEGVSRVITPSTSEDNNNGLTNRKVKTVTVLADGTIVTGDEASAGAQQLPDIRPNVPAVTSGQSESTSTSTDPIGDAIQTAENAAQDLQSTVEDAANQLTGNSSTTEDQTAADENTAGEVVESAPTPPARPEGLGTDQPLASAVLNNAATTSNTASNNDDQPLGLVPDSQPTPTAQPTNNAPVSASTNSVSAPFYVQLASQRTPEAAQQTVTTVSRQFANALGGQTVGVNRVDLDDRGVFYRVLVPASSIESANAICNNVKASGGDCFVRNN